MFKLFSKGDQLKVKLANPKFAKVGTYFSLFGGGCSIGGRD